MIDKNPNKCIYYIYYCYADAKQHLLYSSTRNPSAPMLLFLGFAKEFSVEIKQEKIMANSRQKTNKKHNTGIT